MDGSDFQIDASRRLYRRASRLMPGGVSSPVRSFKSVGGNPLYIKKGKGAHIFDVDGNEYIDYCMSWGPLILGHAEPSVIGAIRRTARLGTSFGTCHRSEVLLAKMIKERFDSIDMVRFVNSGTEAVMSAIRLARGFTGRDKIIKFDGCYHGHVDCLLVAAGSGLATLGTPDSEGVTAGNARDTIVLPFNNTELLARALESDGKNIAAVIMEPVPCNYGLILPKKEFLEAARELCTRHRVLLIFDEVITGFRLAPGGAQEYYKVNADITTFGKIIGGGLPVGAYGAPRKIMKHVSPLGGVYQAGTLSGNPIAMSAGIQTLKRLEDGGYSLLHDKAGRFASLLAPTLKQYAERILFVQLGSIFSFYFTPKREINSVDDVRSCDMNAFAAFHSEMLRRGVYLSPSGFEVGFLSTAHTDDDLSKTADAAAESLHAVFNRAQ